MQNPNIVFGQNTPRDEPIKDQERIVAVLQRVERDELADKVMTYPPVHAKGGEMFLYRCKSPKDRDFTKDMYTHTRADGTKLQAS